MGCAIGCLALAFPRVALVLVWVFGGTYLPSAFPSWVWAAAGLVFLPLTTLAFVFATHSLSEGGHFTPLGWVVVVLAGLIDLGMVGGGRRGVQRHRARRRAQDESAPEPAPEVRSRND